MKNNLAMEIIQPEQFWSVISYLQNPADILSDRGDFYKTVDEMLLDAKIGSHLRLRKDIVVSFPFVINQGKSSDAVYEFVRDNLTVNLNWETDVKEFLSAIEYGHSFSEVLWTRNEAGFLIPDSIRNKYPGQIFYKIGFQKTEGGVKSIWVPVLKNGNKELTDKYKFLTYRNNPRAENPYGNSDLLMCYWPWKFKQLGWEFWLKAAQKAGVPSLVALFDAADSESAKKNAQSISDTLVEMQGGDAAALANVKDVKTLEMSGNLADHKVLIETCNQEISFALTTQSLSTQEGQFGTRAQATVHDENLVRVCHGDAKALQGVFQNLIDWIVELNFGNTAIPPKGEFDLQSYASFNELIQAVQNKIPVSKEALYTRYKLPRPKDDDDVFILEGTNSIALSDSDKKKIQSRLPLKIK
ncbi:phage portal protein family protein [Treponema pedis]|uniref:phage portal protein family protein n=1 Tax=Treponema pedis TaxID=409322 RepID=UPI000423B693